MIEKEGRQIGQSFGSCHPHFLKKIIFKEGITPWTMVSPEIRKFGKFLTTSMVVIGHDNSKLVVLVSD